MRMRVENVMDDFSAASRPCAMRSDNLLAITVHDGQANETYYAVTDHDHLGTVHALVDEDGDTVESYRFDAWGNVLGVYDGNGQPLPSSGIGNRYLFQGREYSWETGLYNFRARWYDPLTGRWLSNDPIGIGGGLNQYVAFGNNPVMFVDPEGRIAHGLGGALILGVLANVALNVPGLAPK